VRDARAWHVGHATIGRGSAERLYYAARNHLRLARRAAPLASPLHAALRDAAIVVLNVARALRGVDVPRLAGLRAVLRGCLDHARGRYGPAPRREGEGGRSSQGSNDQILPSGRI
jgi:hypothetical protein